QNQKRLTYVSHARVEALQWPHGDAPARACRGILAHQLLRDAIHFGLRLRQRDPIFQPRKNQKVVVIPAAIVRVCSQGSPKSKLLGREFEIGRQNSNNREFRIVGSTVDGFTDGPGIAAEVLFPATVAQHNYRIASQVVFFRREQMSQERLDSQHGKEAGGGASALKQNGQAITFQSEVAVFGPGDLLKSPAAPRELLESIGRDKQLISLVGGLRIQDRN